MSHTKPKVIIPTGIGINSHFELGQAFTNAGAEAEYRHINDLIAEPQIIRKYQGMGLAGGFMMGDQLGAGQSTKNRTYDSGLRDVLEDLLNDYCFPIIGICNSLQTLAKLGLLPIQIGTVRNDSGKHETTSWDMKVNSKNKTIWIRDLIDYELPIFAPISHGEGRIIIPEEEMQKVEEMNLIALQYTKGHMCQYFESSRGDRYNPNGSTADIAGLGWSNNLILFPHFERLLKNLQREDKALLQTGKIKDRKYSDTPKGLYEPTYLIFKAAAEFMKE